MEHFGPCTSGCHPVFFCEKDKECEDFFTLLETMLEYKYKNKESKHRIRNRQAMLKHPSLVGIVKIPWTTEAIDLANLWPGDNET